MTIKKFLEVNVRHVPPHDEVVLRHVEFPWGVHADSDGFWIYLPAHISPDWLKKDLDSLRVFGVSAALTELIREGIANDCAWLRLDRGAPLTSGRPVFEREGEIGGENAEE